MNLYTIGFAQKSARAFFDLLTKNGVARVVDIRLNTKSQLAGFTKGDDLAYFLAKIGGIDYRYLPAAAPPKELFDGYRDGKITWPELERGYLQALEQRDILRDGPALFANACLLCSEPKPQQCHRRLLAEYIAGKVPDVKIIHL